MSTDFLTIDDPKRALCSECAHKLSDVDIEGSASAHGGVLSDLAAFRSKGRLSHNGSLASLIGTPHAASPKTSVKTSLFDLFKIGPGPSSSHTIGPMKAAYDFLMDLRDHFLSNQIDPPSESLRLQINMHGSLSATGRGHRTDASIVAGLCGCLPHNCDADHLAAVLQPDSEDLYRIPLFDSLDNLTGAHLPALTIQKTATSELSVKSILQNDSPLLPLFRADEVLTVGATDFVWHDPSDAMQLPHPNTMVLRLLNSRDEAVLEGEYYSVGGGFIEKKGSQSGTVDSAQEPAYPYRNLKELMVHLEKNPELTWAELLMRNEMALTGCTREQVEQGMDNILMHMERSVQRGLKDDSILPGSIRLRRKAGMLFQQAQANALKSDAFLHFINAYCHAVSEENGAGKIVVTAPTSGACGVIPGLLYFMKHHLYYDHVQLRNALMVGGCIGFIVKRNASISGAEMGCMGEVGTASSMGAAMLAYAAGFQNFQVEAAAEIAMEHHLGLTCDPVGGYVQIPCIQRNPFGAIKAYNAYILCSSLQRNVNVVSFDTVIDAMRDTGINLSSKFKETSLGGLALSYTCC